MTKKRPSLFELAVPFEKANKRFDAIRVAPAAAPARAMLEGVFADFSDVDGNFVEQFQTTGFDSRYFELYLFAYLSRSGFRIDRRNRSPDFVVEREGVSVAIEATTTNPSMSGVMKDSKKIAELSALELEDYHRNELAIRLSGSLNAKLRKRYWEQPHCQDIPFVLAIEAFHDEDSLGMSDSSLMQYLYGMTSKAAWSEAADLEVSTEIVEMHAASGKSIPSSFFSQPDTEHISAVLFTNSGTHSKFSRMGFQHGYETDEIEMCRFGTSYSIDPDAMDPTFFSYKLTEPPLVETWGQGISVMHNPRARLPLSKTFFVDSVQSYSQGGAILTDYHGWHPFSSKTVTIDFRGVKKALKKVPSLPPLTEVRPIKRIEFQSAVLSKGSDYVVSDKECGWFADSGLGFYGVLLEGCGHWTIRVFARDEYFAFFKLLEEESSDNRPLAVQQLQYRIADLVRSPQRIFPGRTIASNRG